MPSDVSDGAALPRVFIALGSNLGDRAQQLQEALRLLGETSGVEVVAVSNWMENPAVGSGPDAPPFLNGVAELCTSLSPRQLLSRMTEIEQRLGRIRRERWGARTVDLDLILYGDTIVSEPGLDVPHPRMAERDFVLKPLAELAPEIVHPVLHQRIDAILSKIRP